MSETPGCKPLSNKFRNPKPESLRNTSVCRIQHVCCSISHRLDPANYSSERNAFICYLGSFSGMAWGGRLSAGRSACKNCKSTKMKQNGMTGEFAVTFASSPSSFLLPHNLISSRSTHTPIAFFSPFQRWHLCKSILFFF